MLALKVVVEAEVEAEVDVEGVSEVLASTSAAAPQFGSDIRRCLCFFCLAICSSSPSELSP